MNLTYMVDFPPPSFTGKRPVVYLMHGQGGYSTEEHIEAYKQAFLESLGCVVVRIDCTNNGRGDDQRGCNKSEGSLADFSIEGMLRNLRDVVADTQKTIAERADFSQVIMAGHSYGGMCARTATEYAYANTGDDILRKLGVIALVDLSGVISVPGTTKGLIARALGAAKDNMIGGETTVNRAYGKWSREGQSFGMTFKGSDGQRFYSQGWEGYNAVNHLRNIPPKVAVVFQIGNPAKEPVIWCAGLPEADAVRKFIAAVRERKSGAVFESYDTPHQYTQDVLPQMTADMIAALRPLFAPAVTVPARSPAAAFI
ncbi:MAG: alpha/beta fold hydrolase [Candidatus Omnitrophota bacterium]